MPGVQGSPRDPGVGPAVPPGSARLPACPAPVVPRFGAHPAGGVPPVSEAYFRFVVENVSDVVLVVDAAGTILFESPSVERVLGHKPEERVGANALGSIHPDDLRLALDALAHTLREPGVAGRIIEVRVRHKDGSWRTVQALGQGVVDAEGRHSVILSLRDVTEPRRMEETLRESQRAMATLLSNLPGMAYRCRNDAKWTMEFVSQGSVELTGYRPEDLVRNRRVAYNDIVHPEDQDLSTQDIQRALRARGPFEITYRIVTAGGVVKWVRELGRGVFAEDGGLVALEGFITDITERRRAEEQLVRLAAAVEQAAEDVVLMDVDGNITYVNSAFERTTGYSRAEALNRSPRFLDSGAHDEAFYRDIQAIAGSGRTWKGRFVNRTRDGRVILQDASISAIREPSGRIVGYVSSRRDVTQEVERERHAARAEKLEAIGTLAGGIAHDFNNILSAIVGYAQMAQMKCPPGSAIHQDLEAVLQGSRRAADLVRQILTFSRQERGEERPVQVSLVVKEATRFLRATIPSTIEIRGDFRSESVVLAEPTEIHRIVVNLCTNASLAMRGAGGVLDVGLADVEVDAAEAARHPGLAPGRYLRLRVRDTGCGMPPEVVAHIFEPFYTTRAEGEGTGMGLAVVHGIVKRCRGAIVVESAPGRGSTFDVLLPVAPCAAPAAPAASEAAPVGTERVLFVDDEPLVAGLAVDMLGQLGYRVRTFTDSRQALAAFEADPDAFDILVTDMTMPGMTGEELARRAKALRPRLPVVLCTGYSETMTAEKARALGIDEFVMKPVAGSDLTRLVRAALDRR